MSEPVFINKMSWFQALDLAIMVYQRDRRKQRVYKHPVYGWTWGQADDRG